MSFCVARGTNPRNMNVTPRVPRNSARPAGVTGESPVNSDAFFGRNNPKKPINIVMIAPMLLSKSIVIPSWKSAAEASYLITRMIVRTFWCL